jgi:hypothetical protein
VARRCRASRGSAGADDRLAGAHGQSPSSGSAPPPAVRARNHRLPRSHSRSRYDDMVRRAHLLPRGAVRIRRCSTASRSVEGLRARGSPGRVASRHPRSAPRPPAEHVQLESVALNITPQLDTPPARALNTVAIRSRRVQASAAPSVCVRSPRSARCGRENTRSDYPAGPRFRKLATRSSSVTNVGNDRRTWKPDQPGILRCQRVGRHLRRPRGPPAPFSSAAPQTPWASSGHCSRAVWGRGHRR